MKSQYDSLAHLYDDFLFLPKEKLYLDYLTIFLKKNYIKQPQQSILEIGCGTGNRLLPFEKEHHCVGIDNSRAMLNQASQKLKSTQLLKMDFTDFKLDKKFDVVLCLFDTLNHTNNVASVFSSVKNHMSINSIFIFDYYTQYGMKKNIESKTENLSIHQTSDTSFEWLINFENNTYCIEEFTIPLLDLLLLIKKNFDFEIFNQEFKKIDSEQLLLESNLSNYQIERVLAICSLR